LNANSCFDAFSVYKEWFSKLKKPILGNLSTVKEQVIISLYLQNICSKNLTCTQQTTCLSSTAVIPKLWYSVKPPPQYRTLATEGFDLCGLIESVSDMKVKA
jgi:hypothetical protein